MRVENPGARQLWAMKPSFNSARQTASSPRFQSQLGIFNRYDYTHTHTSYIISLPRRARWTTEISMLMFVRLSVSLSAPITQKPHCQTSPNVSVNVAYGRSLVLMWRRCDTLGTEHVRSSNFERQHLGYRAVLFALSSVKPFWHNTGVWQTVRQTAYIHRSSIVSCGKKWK